MPLFDTHAHYNDDAFDQNRKGLLDALPDAGVGAVVIPGVDVESSRSALALAESRPWLFAAAGIHPEDCAGCTAADFSAIRDLCREKKVVAIGEIGLDYYWAENPPKEFQQMVFRRQLELALELELPVISQWDYPALKVAPCRYSGSLYQDNLIICAHNYASHFGKLKELQPGDTVLFTDMDEHVVTFQVVERETLNPMDAEGMEAGDWDLTLFTCTIGGQTRVTIRLERVEVFRNPETEEPAKSEK